MAASETSKREPPAGLVQASTGRLSYLIQKRDATRLQYEFRLEFDGILPAWAASKGASLNAADKRLAVEVEEIPWPTAVHATRCASARSLESVSHAPQRPARELVTG
jgi:hypothetical protein